MAFNKWIGVGRICSDPEMKYTPAGVALCNFRIAVDRDFGGKGEDKETDFIDVTAWRQQAEFTNQYLGKGRLVLVEGRLQSRKWQTQDGQKRTAWDIQADKVQGLDSPKQGQQAEREETPYTQGYKAPSDDDAPFAGPDPFKDQ